MKYLASLLIISVVAFSSCKKNYKCTCVTTKDGKTTTTVYPFDKYSQKEAQIKCDLYTQQQNNTLVNATANCNL